MPDLPGALLFNKDMRPDAATIDVAIANTNAPVAAGNVFGITGTAAGNTANTSVVFRSTFKVTSDSSFTITGASVEFSGASPQAVSLDDSTTLDNVSLSTAANAGTAISIIDTVIEQLQSRRVMVGNVTNHLDIADTELASRLENLNSAESVIRDADVAAETAKYTLYNVLQQVGATVLAQANIGPQIALTLLRQF